MQKEFETPLIQSSANIYQQDYSNDVFRGKKCFDFPCSYSSSFPNSIENFKLKCGSHFLQKKIEISTLTGCSIFQK